MSNWIETEETDRKTEIICVQFGNWLTKEIDKASVKGWDRKWSPGFVPTLAYQFCQNLPEKLSQSGAPFFLGQSCTFDLIAGDFSYL